MFDSLSPGVLRSGVLVRYVLSSKSVFLLGRELPTSMSGLWRCALLLDPLVCWSHVLFSQGDVLLFASHLLLIHFFGIHIAFALLVCAGCLLVLGQASGPEIIYYPLYAYYPIKFANFICFSQFRNCFLRDYIRFLIFFQF